MGTKTNPGKFDCYGTADPDEPIFVLIARDPLAAQTVRDWAYRRRTHKTNTVPGYSSDNDAKFAEALGVARAMEAWQADQGRAKTIAAEKGVDPALVRAIIKRAKELE